MDNSRKDLVTITYELAKDFYEKRGIDVEQALKQLDQIQISMHCWQGDDVRGFEDQQEALSGGIQVTGNYPGKATTPQELRDDMDMAFSMLPGKQRVNLHALYGEGINKDERHNIQPKHFENWVAWAKDRQIGLDFNPTCFSHDMAADGFTLSHWDEGIRQYWIEHCKASRRIGAYFGKELGTPAVTNIWIPDGFKDIPIDRLGPRERLREALDDIFSEEISEDYNLDAVESKLFGIGAESYTVGSHEFYMAYAMQNKKMVCLDTGHFHPTEVVSDKISALLPFMDRILLHVSRPIRWDSDHVVILDEELVAIAREVVRGNAIDRVHIGLDFFDASINRIAAWVIGVRNMQKALLQALLEPVDYLKSKEINKDYTSRLVLLEEQKSLPWSSIWDYYCYQSNVPVGDAWLQEIKNYEECVLKNR